MLPGLLILRALYFTQNPNETKRVRLAGRTTPRPRCKVNISKPGTRFSSPIGNTYVWCHPCRSMHPTRSYTALPLLRFATLQVSCNVLLGRSHIGVHWRMDGVNGALMGETSAVRRLQQVQSTLLLMHATTGVHLIVSEASHSRNSIPHPKADPDKNESAT